MKSVQLLLYLLLVISQATFSQENALPRSVAVFCASSDKINPLYLQAARDVGRLCAENNMVILFGGANSGMMGAMADAALAAGGTLKGFLPEAGRIWNVDHKEIQEMNWVQSVYERLREFDEADAFIVLPGGIGTFHEALNVMAPKQYGIHAKPIIFVNVGGFFNNFLTFLEGLVLENTLKREHLNLVTVVSSVDEMINALQKQSDGFLTHEWWRI